MSAQVNDGDWVEGTPKWWWKYVFPAPEVLWATVVAGVSRVSDPEPSPWRQQVGELLEGIVMLHTSSKVTDHSAAQRLHKEAISRISSAAETMRKTGARAS